MAVQLAQLCPASTVLGRSAARALPGVVRHGQASAKIVGAAGASATGPTASEGRHEAGETWRLSVWAKAGHRKHRGLDKPLLRFVHYKHRVSVLYHCVSAPGQLTGRR